MSSKWSALVVVLILPAFAAGAEEKGWLGVQIKLENDKIVVVGAQADSPAEKAKLQENDVIKKFGDKEPKDLQEFVDEVGSKKPGDKVTLVIERDGKEMKIEIKLGKRPAEL